MSHFREDIHAGKVLIADGATGTNLQQRGLPSGKSGEFWVLEKPEEILRLERNFLEAGSNLILTCTFGATRKHLEGSGLDREAERINRTAVQLARKSAEPFKAYVAGSIGPTGQLLEPMGDYTVQEAEDVFFEQAKWLVDEGVDLLIVETQFDMAEAIAALRAVRSLCSLPLVCSFSYDRGTKTMMGVSPTKMAAALAEFDLDLLGINCGKGLDDNMKCLQELRAVTDKPIWFKPNAGLPVVSAEGKATYPATPADMATEVPLWIKLGAQVIGGCCGASPEHIRAIAEAKAKRV
ncbi:MAG TPA: homocysteine S-methyltransferase family protein [Bellilinea sp.]|nr:homocysteine S-methyltransferase family protein [Bellilinea sp.]